MGIFVAGYSLVVGSNGELVGVGVSNHYLIQLDSVYRRMVYYIGH